MSATPEDVVRAKAGANASTGSAQDYDDIVKSEYEHGFITEIESDTLPPGLDEDVIRAISARKNEPEFMLEWRLAAYRKWLEMPTPHWASVHHPAIDYQAISYFSAPKSKRSLGSRPPGGGPRPSAASASPATCDRRPGAIRA